MSEMVIGRVVPCMHGADSGDRPIAGRPLVDIYRENVIAKVREAVLAERERCAKIAEKYSPSCEDWSNPTSDIAAEIRKGV